MFLLRWVGLFVLFFIFVGCVKEKKETFSDKKKIEDGYIQKKVYPKILYVGKGLGDRILLGISTIEDILSIYSEDKYTKREFGLYDIVELPFRGISFVFRDDNLFAIRLHNAKYEKVYVRSAKVKTEKGLSVFDSIDRAILLYGKPDFEGSFPLAGIKNPVKAVFSRYKKDLIGALVVYYQKDTREIIRIESYYNARKK
jgi:hypothetical protein